MSAPHFQTGSYTQWELYLAFHHGEHRLIFEAQAGVPRSPLFAPNTGRSPAEVQAQLNAVARPYGIQLGGSS